MKESKENTEYLKSATLLKISVIPILESEFKNLLSMIIEQFGNQFSILQLCSGLILSEVEWIKRPKGSKIQNSSYSKFTPADQGPEERNGTASPAAAEPRPVTAPADTERVVRPHLSAYQIPPHCFYHIWT